MIVAFSLYSQIPMPVFEWKEENKKHIIAFLPWIGAVIGLLTFGLHALYSVAELPLICRVALYSLVPLSVTGGFHLDGYMDVQDALKSYRTPKEKLAILKDPHIGAFAVIRFLIYGLIWGAALSVITENPEEKFVYAYCVIFYLARAVSTLSSLKFKHARDNGMLNMETEKSTEIDFIMGIVQTALAVALLAWVHPMLSLAGLQEIQQGSA